MPCIFCQIVKGEIPSEKIYENDRVLAFLDINPVNKGHTLVIPKAHYENLESIPDYLFGELAMTTQRLVQAVKKGVKAEAINLGLNDGKVAGQVIPHLHFHLIPRFKDDGLVPWPSKKYKKGEMEKTAKAIREHVPIPFLRIVYKINKHVLILGIILFVLGALKFFKLPDFIFKVARDEFFWTGILLIIYSLIIYLSQIKVKK